MKKGSTQSLEARLKISAAAVKRERRKRGGRPTAAQRLAKVAGRHGEEVAD